MEYLIFEIGIVIIFSSIVGTLLYFFRQPLILAYILTGILIGPVGFGLIEDVEFIHGISKIGIMLMLFLIGLEMNTSRLKDLGLVSLIAGIGQVAITGSVGFALVQLFGFSTIQSVYIAIALTFSSTVIAIKLMSDKKDTKSFYGQICIGILIVQDILAIISLLLLAGFKEGSFSFDSMYFLEILVEGLIMGIITILISKYILKYIYNKIATSHELLILFSLSWCFLISLISMKIGFSIEIGAFIAGLSLANLPYTFEINSKARVLRDFFITIFFVSLGSGLVFSSLGDMIIPTILLSLFVLIGNPIIVLAIMGMMGYDKRTAFFTGLSIANISEFSLIVIALGIGLGHLDQQTASMVTIIGILTMVISSYMITYNNTLYNVLKNYLSFFERKKKVSQRKPKKEKIENHIILFGYDKTGSQVLDQVLSFKEDYLVIDHDHQKIRELIDLECNCIFGDVEDEELLDSLDIEHAEIIISTLPNIEDNYILLRYISELPGSRKPIVICTANSAREGLSLVERGADYIVLKPYLGAHHIHSINKKIYQIENEFEVKRRKKIEKSGKKMKHEHHEDWDVIHFIQDFNEKKMKEIKNKILQNKLKFISKKIDVKKK